MDFQNERYVRFYLRRTITWKLLTWQGQAVLPELLRSVDRAGVLDLGGITPAEAMSLILPRWPIEVIEIAMADLIARDVVEHRGGVIVWPKFLEAQEVAQTDRARASESRAKRRSVSVRLSQNVTPESRNVTESHETLPERHSEPPEPDYLETTSLVVSASSPKSTRPPPEVSIEEIVDAWRRVCVPKGAPNVREVTASRAGKLRLRIHQHPTYAWWDELFVKIAQTPFLFGNGSRGWRVDLDWLIANDRNALKIVEGKYDDIPQTTRRPRHGFP